MEQMTVVPIPDRRQAVREHDRLTDALARVAAAQRELRDAYRDLLALMREQGYLEPK